MSYSGSETTPLISELGANGSDRHVILTGGLPHLQIATLLLAYFAETIIAVFAYPFLPQLIGGLDVVRGHKDRVGYFMGALDSIGYITTAVTVLLWGKFSDTYGRRYVLLACSAGLTIAIIFFGLSKTYTALVLSKFMEGAFKANKPTVKTAFAELSNGDESKMAKMFALMPIVYAAGATIGPFVGGTFSQPYERYPESFGGPFWKEHPYLLPCLAASGFCVLAFLVTLLAFKETLTSERRFKDVDSVAQVTVAESSDAVPETQYRTAPAHRLVVVLLNYAIFVFLDVSFGATFALFLSSPIDLGGLEFSPRAIGLVLGLAGIFHGLFQAFFFAHIHKRWEPRRVYAISISAYIPIYLCMPVMNALAKRAHRVTPLVWVFLALVEVACTFAYTAFSCMYIFITLASPSPAALGRTHAAAQTVFSLMGALGPVMTTSLVAASVQYNLVGGTLAYIVMAVLGCIAVGLASLLPMDTRRHQQNESL